MHKLEKAWREEIAPPPDVGMLEWCRRSIVIPRETGTPWPGPFSDEETPWVRGWYEVIEDIATRVFAIQKGAQVAASQTFSNAAFYFTCNDPGSLLAAWDSLDMARDTSKLRLKPTIDASPVLKAEIRDGGDELENVVYRWKRCFWRLIGASSAGKASSFTHRFLILEEPDKYPDIVGSEGNVIENMLKRLLLMWNSLVLINCTPTVPSGYIHKYVNLGDRMFYHVPCPKCAAMIVLRFLPEFGRLTYPEALPCAFAEFDRELSPVEAGRKARLVCQLCKSAITDSQKRTIVDAGEWRTSKKPEMTGHRSAVISGLYPKVEASTTRAFVEDFLKSHQDHAKLQIFVNQKDGNVWAPPPKKEISRQRIMKIRDMLRYPRGTVPTDGPCYLVMLCDVQAHTVPFAVWAMDPLNQWLVDHGNLSTIEDVPEAFTAVYHRAVWDKTKGQFVRQPEQELQCTKLLSDSRHRTTEVYNFCATHPYAVPIMGQHANVRQGIPVRWRDTDKLPSGRPIIGEREIKVGYLHPSMFKDHFAWAVDATLWPDDAPTPPPSKVKVWFHEEIDQQYVHQINGEVLREGPPDRTGFRRTWWEKVHTNDQFDLAQYGFATRHIAHNDLMRLTRKAKPKAAAAAAPAEGEPEPAAAVAPPPAPPKRKRLTPWIEPGSVNL